MNKRSIFSKNFQSSLLSYLRPFVKQIIQYVEVANLNFEVSNNPTHEPRELF